MANEAKTTFAGTTPLGHLFLLVWLHSQNWQQDSLELLRGFCLQNNMGPAGVFAAQGADENSVLRLTHRCISCSFT